MRASTGAGSSAPRGGKERALGLARVIWSGCSGALGRVASRQVRLETRCLIKWSGGRTPFGSLPLTTKPQAPLLTPPWVRHDVLSNALLSFAQQGGEQQQLRVRLHRTRQHRVTRAPLCALFLHWAVSGLAPLWDWTELMLM